MTRFLIITVLLTLWCFLGGCNSYWYQEGKSFDQCSNDRGDCFSEVKKYYDLDNIGKPEKEFMEDCMIRKGYILQTEDKLPPKVRRRDPDRSFYWFTNGLAGTVEE